MFDPQKEYIITVKDANNDVQKMEMGKMIPDLSIFEITGCWTIVEE